MAVEVITNAHDALERATTTDELCMQMRRFRLGMGFAYCAYALAINVASFKPRCYCLNEHPQQGLERYMTRDYSCVDPLVQHAQHSSLPAIWNEQSFHSGAAKEFWEDARGFRLKAGMSFLVHEQGVTGIFSLARDNKIDQSGQEFAALIGRGQMFTSSLHHAVCRVDLPKLLPQINTILTARERECLKWSADGKTAWELGQILGISARTAVFHVSNAMQKLGAANKIQAIVRAVALKLI